jgi:hypothetical protein
MPPAACLSSYVTETNVVAMVIDYNQSDPLHRLTQSRGN